MGVGEKWRGQTALLTGASAGIGTEMARILAAGGCHLIVAARRMERLEALKDEIETAHDVTVRPIAVDLSEPGSARTLYERTAELDRPVDLLINNAGFGLSGAFRSTDWEREAQMIQLNAVSLVELTKLFLPSMLARDRGDILLVSSIAAVTPVPTFAVYAATKAFVTHFGQALSFELRKTGVRVTVANPGGTATEFSDVSGMKPGRMARLGTMPADRVARIALKAMAKGRRSVITGRMYAFTMWLTRFFPLGLRLRSAALFQKAAGGGE